MKAFNMSSTLQVKFKCTFVLAAGTMFHHRPLELIHLYAFISPSFQLLTATIPLLNSMRLTT